MSRGTLQGRLDKVIHKCMSLTGKDVKFTPFAQWYFFAMVILILGFFHAFFNIVWYDYYEDKFLFSSDYQKRVRDNSPKSLGSVVFPKWLKFMAIIAPIVGWVAFLINIYHVCVYTKDRSLKKLERVKKLEVAVGTSGEPLLPKILKVDDAVNVKMYPANVKGKILMINDDEDDPTPVEVELEDGVKSWVGWTQVEVCVEESNPWRLLETEELTLLVIMMPGVFIVMAMQALIRILEVFSGSTWTPTSTVIDLDEDWKTYVLWRRNTYLMDLDIAAAFQYVTVFAFAMLCAQYFSMAGLNRTVLNREKKLSLKIDKLEQDGKVDSSSSATRVLTSELKEELTRANEEHSYSLKWAGLQGIGFYILVGVGRCLVNIICAGMKELHEHKALLMQVLDKYQPVFISSTILCIYNWTVIQTLEDIKSEHAFGPRATFKFIAVRGLLLIGDAQANVLRYVATKSWINFTAHQADLLHVILLMIECLAVVLWNLAMWRRPVTTRG